jgi:hypothetical protein
MLPSYAHPTMCTPHQGGGEKRKLFRGKRKVLCSFFGDFPCKKGELLSEKTEKTWRKKKKGSAAFLLHLAPHDLPDRLEFVGYQHLASWAPTFRTLCRYLISCNQPDVAGMMGNSFLHFEGAGRRMSRTKAFSQISQEDFEASMAGIVCDMNEHLRDEAPTAYKDLTRVMANQVPPPPSLPTSIIVNQIDHLLPSITFEGSYHSSIQLPCLG